MIQQAELKFGEPQAPHILAATTTMEAVVEEVQESTEDGESEKVEKKSKKSKKK
jgi:hypothetical protein